MKQYITLKQLDELSKEQADKLYEWYQKIDSFENSEFPPYLSIGQMIEFLRTDKNNIYTIYQSDLVKSNVDGKTEKIIKYEELCDALWEAVKEVLEDK